MPHCSPDYNLRLLVVLKKGRSKDPDASTLGRTTEKQRVPESCFVVLAVVLAAAGAGSAVAAVIGTAVAAAVAAVGMKILGMDNFPVLLLH